MLRKSGTGATIGEEVVGPHPLCRWLHGSVPGTNMKRLVWLTDIHLNFVKPPAIETFCQEIVEQRADALLISGDIGEAPDVAHYLSMLESRLRMPIYFVLGNHDFYRGSITGVREAIKALTARSTSLHWLPQTGMVQLAPGVVLMGHDGWCDGRCGNYSQSRVFHYLNDFRLISDFAGLDRGKCLDKLMELGDEAASYFAQLLPTACDRSRQILVATHVPPFQEAAWYSGGLCDADWMPFFSCEAVGKVLKSAMEAHPECHMTVLCGHTHSGGTVSILPNLQVATGAAEYRFPTVQRILEVE
jgi:3',5'-cyclic-AMP phosphodiesterase